MATVAYVKSGAGAVPLANQAWANGDKMVPAISDATTNFAVARKWVWETTTAGTSTGTPTWPAAVTQDVTTVTQNGVVWTARKPGFSSGTTANWAYSTIYLLYGEACQAAAGDITYVSNNHAETQGAAYTSIAIAGGITLCVDDGVAPPTALALTAAITLNGATSNLAFTGIGSYRYGLILTAGSGQSTTCSIVNNSAQSFENCQFILASTGASSLLNFGNNPLLTNCDYKFGAAGQGINGGGMRIIGGSLLSGGTSPTALISNIGSSTGNGDTTTNRVCGLDLSNASASINLSTTATNGGIQFYDIELPASWSGSVSSATVTYNTVYDMQNSDNTGTNYIIQRKGFAGLLTQETSIVRSGGASNGVTALSWKIVTNASALYPQRPFVCPEIVKWYPITGFSVGGAVNVTVELVTDNVILTDKDVWVEIISLNSSGAPLGTLTTSRGPLVGSATNLTTSAASWGGGLGTPKPQSITLNITPNLAGIMHVTVKVAKASTTVYVDPQLTFS